MSIEKFDKPEESSSVGPRLQEYLQSAGLKAADLVRKTGIPKTTISDTINGKHGLTIHNFELIVRHTDLDPLWLLTGEGKMKREPARAVEHIYPRLAVNGEKERKKLAERILSHIPKLSIPSIPQD
jgi:transcriptional regulator with XRE-family HTH domain